MVVAAELKGVSERHRWGLLAGYRKEGASGIAHGNRWRKPAGTTDAGTRQRVRELAEGVYAGLNHTHLTEILGEREGIELSRSTVRRILLAGGMRSPRRRRSPRRYRRRERYPREGMLLQVDGSRHDWLQGRGPYLTLVGAVDDATGKVPGALFREQEDAQGYMLVLKEIIDNHGVPLALYSDRHSIFQRSPKEPESIEEELRGRRDPTQFGRALEELDIRLMLAHTPQAKGRIEREWGTFQDRLVSEMGLAGVSTMEEANRTLRNFLPRFNARFAVPPAQPGSAYRPVPPSVCLDGVLCFKYLRTVARDNTVGWDRSTIQLMADEYRVSYARATVEVQERLDGSVVVTYQGRTLGTRPAPPHPVTLRARTTRRGGGVNPHPPDPERHNGAKGRVGATPQPSTRTTTPERPPPNHPWRRRLLT